MGAGHPLLGRRMPDLEVSTAQGTVRVFSLLHKARAVLLNFGKAGAIGTERVRVVEAKYEGSWELPVFGAVAAPSAVLVRPDGYVAWVGDGTTGGLEEALRKWFGGAK